MKSLNQMNAEFRRGKDKKKRKQRSLKDNLLGTTTAGRLARVAGLVAAGGYALRLAKRTRPLIDAPTSGKSGGPYYGIPAPGSN